MCSFTRLALLISLIPGAVTVPAIEVGTFELTSSSDPDWTYDRYTQLENGNFSGWGNGTWSGITSNYTYWGEATEYSCLQYGNEDVVVMVNYWFHDDMNHAPDTKVVTCSYRNYSAQARTITVKQFRAAEAVSMDFSAGSCPESAEEAASGISWMTDGSTAAENTWECVDGCQPWNCADYAGTGAVTVPAIEVGTFELTSSSDPDWTYDRYTQLENGNFSGWGNGTWSGITSNYTYWGEATEYSCLQHGNEDVVVMVNYWFHDDMNHAPDTKVVTCSYRNYSAQARTITVKQFRAAEAVSMDFSAGSCPESAEEAASGISWMTDGSTAAENTWECVDGCQPWDCAETASASPISPPSPDDNAAREMAVPGCILLASLLFAWLEINRSVF
ncbi:hypothetical protein CYMTET_5682 [Cymbomonas tetramitiformis]|uniref:Uncharacterized protein n=1 Tax=Cymbomonas tetramitiformis TaxID=36881 RepID=A0AAE0GYL6_9CHLO|nr:hypothetical protein CYMTET_5682 [Cymbomonas tetramitiformis]